MRLRFLPLAALSLGGLLAGCAATPYGGYYDAGPYYGGAYGSYDPYYGGFGTYYRVVRVYPGHHHERDRFHKHRRHWKDVERDRGGDRHGDHDGDHARDEDGDRDDRRSPDDGGDNRPALPDWLPGQGGARPTAAPPAEPEKPGQSGGERLVTELLEERRK